MIEMVLGGAVSVRVVGVLIGASVMMIGMANASSFVVAQPPTAKVSKSFVYVGLPAPVGNRTAETGSVTPLSPFAIATAIARSTAAAFQRHELDSAPRSERASAEPTVPLAFPLPEANRPTIRQVSPSIIAFDESFPAVAFEKVAAISVAKPKPFHRRPETVAMLIRGGIVDSGIPGSAAPVTAVSVKASAPAAAAKSNASNRSDGGGKPPNPEEPVKIAPPPPPPNMPRLRGPE
jgi:hypothetical protein